MLELQQVVLVHIRSSKRGNIQFLLAFCSFLYTSEELLFINICSLMGPTLMHGIPMRLVLTQTEGQPPFFWLLLGRIYNFTSPFSGIKVKVTNHGFIWCCYKLSTGSPSVLSRDKIRIQLNEQSCFISALMHLS